MSEVPEANKRLELQQAIIGEIVVLRSGGPKMTIISEPEPLKEIPKVTCTWMDGGKYSVNSFPIACLNLVGEDASEPEST